MAKNKKKENISISLESLYQKTEDVNAYKFFDEAFGKESTILPENMKKIIKNNKSYEIPRFSLTFEQELQQIIVD